MRLVSAILVALVAVVPAAAQNEDTWPSGAAQQASPGSKFRKPSPARVKARTAARKAQGNPQQAEGHSARGTAASPKATAARKRIAPRRIPIVAREPAALPGGGRPPHPVGADLDPANTPDRSTASSTTRPPRPSSRSSATASSGKPACSTPRSAPCLPPPPRREQAQVGWTVVDDPVTGARLGLPGQADPEQDPGKTGTRWSSAQGQVQVETFRIREPGTTLAAVFEQQKKEPAEPQDRDQRAARRLLRPVSGTQGLKKFYVRAEIKDGEVRGITMLYDQVMEHDHGPGRRRRCRAPLRRFPARPVRRRPAPPPSARSNTAPASWSARPGTS